MMTTPEVSAILRISRQTVRRLIRLGVLRASRVGRAFRVSREDLADYLKQAAA